MKVTFIKTKVCYYLVGVLTENMLLKRRFLMFLFGVFLIITSVQGIYSVVSSLNVEHGLGTTSFAFSYGTSIVVSMLLPAVAHFVNVKTIFIIFQAFYILFLLGNLYTSYYTLLPGGLFLGIAEAGFWSFGSMINTAFATKVTKCSNGNSLEKTLSRFTGYFFTAVQCGSVAGNGVNVIFFRVDEALSGANNFTHIAEYSHCGANDCQIENITQGNLAQYKPHFSSTRYALIAFLCVLVIVCVLTQACCIPADICVQQSEQKHEDVSQENSRMRNLDYNIEVENTEHEQRSCDRLSSENIQEEETAISCNGNNVTIQTNDCTIENHSVSILNHKNASVKKILLVLFKSTGMFMIKPKHLLVMLLPIYNGLVLGFVSSELTRAYTSCVLGVDKVGIGFMCFGITDALFSYLSGLVTGKYGRNIPYVFAFVLDITIYTLCLNWKITEHNSWLIYSLFLAFGVTDGVWQAQINNMYGDYFKGEEKVAYSIWNLLVVSGIFIQYSISKSLCMYQKFYLQIVVLCLAVLGYVISYYNYVFRPKHAKGENVT